MPRASWDLVFDFEGNLVGNHDGDLVKSDGTGLEVFVAGIGMLYGMEYLPDGDLIALTDETDEILRISPDGVVTTLATDIDGYGIAVGSDGSIYTTGSDYGMLHVDPATGETLGTASTGWLERVLAFGPDERLYMSYEESDGYSNVYAFSLGDDGEILPDYDVLVSDDWETWLALPDGIGVDACGNVYFTEIAMGRLYRWTTDGTLSIYYEFSAGEYGSGIEWGSGIGPWRNDALYLSQPRNGDQILEVVGVPSGRPSRC